MTCAHGQATLISLLVNVKRARAHGARPADLAVVLGLRRILIIFIIIITYGLQPRNAFSDHGQRPVWREV